MGTQTRCPRRCIVVTSGQDREAVWSDVHAGEGRRDAALFVDSVLDESLGLECRPAFAIRVARAGRPPEQLSGRHVPPAQHGCPYSPQYSQRQPEQTLSSWSHVPSAQHGSPVYPHDMHVFPEQTSPVLRQLLSSQQGSSINLPQITH